MMDSNTFYKNLLNKAVQLLAQRNHSSIELKQKLSLFYLKKYAHDFAIDDDLVKQQIDTAIQHCIAHNWINDIQYIQQYIDMRSRKGYGPNRIIGELKQHGFGLALVKEIFTAKNIDWYEVGLIRAQKKFQNFDKKDYQQKLKLFQFLTYRGFQQDHINQIYSLL
ncbi:regulatory protein RecX [Orbus sturtevantii]|uniref:regulatory protein RecX n=1 Tax=Orbus sturtevantii TaxID=3074109 RepID=UPI00370D6F3F